MKNIGNKCQEFFIALSIGLILLSCNKPIGINDNKPPLTTTPGRFSIEKIDGLGKESSTADALVIDTVTFALGDLRSSKDFYFFLKNTGGRAIRNVTIQSSDSAFEVSPKTINTLLPDDSSTVVSVLRIGAIHGNTLNGVGYVGIMPMGMNTAGIIISGETFNENDSLIRTALNMTVSVNALVADIVLLNGDTAVDLSKPQNINSILFGNVLAPTLSWQVLSDSFQLVNTGNVPLGITEYYDASDRIKLLRSTALAVGDTLKSKLTLLIGAMGVSNVWLKINTSNTIADYNKLKPDEEGNAHLNMFRLAAATSSIITVAYPNGGETFSIGDSVTIQWSCADTFSNPVIIELQTPQAQFPVARTRIRGLQGWTIPVSFAGYPGLSPVSDSCRIVIYDSLDVTHRDSSDGFFTITQ